MIVVGRELGVARNAVRCAACDARIASEHPLVVLIHFGARYAFHPDCFDIYLDCVAEQRIERHA